MAKVTITIEDKDGEIEVEMESTPHFKMKELTMAQKFGIRALEFIKSFGSLTGGTVNHESITTLDGKEHKL